MLKIFLIRHTESKFNKIGRHQGQRYDSVLSELGKEQAERLAKKFKDEKINKIYSSDMKRAFQTAKIIADKLGLEIIKERDLREFNQGKFGGKNFKEKFKEYYKKEFEKGVSKYHIRPPGGENIWDFIMRVRRFIKRLEKEKGKIIVVSHGGTNNIFMSLVCGLKKDKFKREEQDNGCINILEFKNKKWGIKEINNIKHLRCLKKD